MLSKLLKYDFKYMIKTMFVFYALSIFFALTTRFLLSINQTVMVSIISGISVGCMFSMIANILINTMLRSWFGFQDTLYKDSSYLTHTLPITKKEIYESKFVQTLLFLLIGFLVIVLSLFIAYYSKDNFITLKTFISEFSNGLNLSITFAIVSIFVILFLEFFNVIQSGYFGIILGYRKNNNKIGNSVLYSFIIYMFSQLIIILLLFIFGLFNNNIMDLFTSNVLMDVSIIKSVVVFAIVSYSLVIFIVNILCVKYLEKGVNIE